MNNPLMYTDPSGYTWFSQFGDWISQNWKPILSTIATAAIITAACLIPGVGEAACLGAYFNVALQDMSGNINSFSGFMSAVGVGALTGMIGAGIGSLVATVTKAGYIIPGIIAGAVSGGISGAVAGGLSQGLDNYFLGNGDFWGGLGQGAISGLITGGILGAITGGIQGYKNAIKAGVDPWTGEMDDARTYCSSTDGVDPGNFKQPYGNKDCYAYESAYSNPYDQDPQDYENAMKDNGNIPDGALEKDVARNMCAQHYNEVSFSSIKDFDQMGQLYGDGYSLNCSSPDPEGLATGHGVVITKITVVDKINFFFGGTHQILQNVFVMDPLQGNIVPGGYYLKGSIISIIKW